MSRQHDLARNPASVPGWLARSDELLIELIMRWQTKIEPPGDVVELGVYEGRSAIHIGRFVQPGETFTVCDLFEDLQTSPEATHVRRAYASLSQASFERNYLHFHTQLPVVVRGPTSEIGVHVAAGTCRFVHIDASHLYDDVRADTMTARALLRANGVVAFDDFRHPRTLGTAAAVWEAVANDGLVPVCASAKKLYATWGDPAPLQAAIESRLSRRKRFSFDTTEIRGRPVMRVFDQGAAAKPAPPEPPTALHLRAAAALGFGLSRFGYRLTRLATQERPGAAALAAGRRRVARTTDRFSARFTERRNR